MVATFSGMPVTRMSRNITRIAKSDGTMALSRAGPLLKTSRKVTKMTAKVMAKLWVRVGTSWAAIVACSTPLPTIRYELPARAGESARGALPRHAHRPLERRGAAVLARPRGHGQVGRAHRRHVDPLAQGGLLEQELLEVGGQARQLGGIRGQRVALAGRIAAQAQERRQADHRADRGVVAEPAREVVEGGEQLAARALRSGGVVIQTATDVSPRTLSLKARVSRATGRSGST